MITIVAPLIVGKTTYAPFFDTVERHAKSLISTYNLCIGIRRINAQNKYSKISEEYALGDDRIKLILSDPTQSDLLTKRCVELLLMNSLENLL